MKNKNGFTLIEVLIAIALLGMISVTIYKTVTSSFRLRTSLAAEGEFNNSVRLAMSIIERDISRVFTPIGLVPNQEQPNSKSQEAISQADLDREMEFWTPAVHPSGIRMSRFKGDESSISFVSSSHIKIYRDVPEAELIQVSYELEDDDREEAPERSKVLVRKINSNVFVDPNDKDWGKKTYPLLTGVKELKLKYFDPRKDDWRADWENARSSGNKWRYPSRVSIEMMVESDAGFSFFVSEEIPLDIPVYSLKSAGLSNPKTEPDAYFPKSF